MKLLEDLPIERSTPVAPHVGAWIEINPNTFSESEKKVAPHVGAWIEMSKSGRDCTSTPVAPHVGAWIEILEPQSAHCPLNTSLLM